MKPRAHVYSSAILSGTIYALTQSAQMAVSTFVGGVFMDVDHVLDFVIFSEERFSIKGFFSWFNDTKWEKVTLLFHSYEACFVLFVVTILHPNDIFIGVLSGCVLHLSLDQIGLRGFFLRIDARPAPLYYFLSYRYFVGFQKSKLIRKQPGWAPGKLDGISGEFH